jgi:hypothetical protein
LEDLSVTVSHPTPFTPRDAKRALRLIILVQVGVMAFAVLASIAVFWFAHREPAPTSKDFQGQMDTLNRTSDALKDLTEFVAAQKRRLAETEGTLALLNNERERLKPIVEADRQIIDAVFVEENARRAVDVWKERGFGFVAGTIGSMLATGLCWALVRATRRVGQT